MREPPLKPANPLHLLLLSGAALSLVACATDAEEPAAPEAPAVALQPPEPVKVGEFMPVDERSPAFSPTNPGERDLVWEREFHYPDATFIAVHFSHFSLPEGASLIVRTPDDTRIKTYTLDGKKVPEGAGIWAMHMPGDRAIVRLYSTVPVPADAVVIDKFSRGLANWNAALPKYTPKESMDHDKAICGADDSEWARCYEMSEPTVYSESRAVARLLIGGASLCTGWLVGSEGHLMTNEHCIGNATDAANTDYEFGAEGATCATDCSSSLACAGPDVESGGTLVQNNVGLDYALISLATDYTGTYGYMQMRDSGALLNERIYIPQHPAGWGKKIALVAGGQDATITSLTRPACDPSSPVDDVGYMADTQGGSSGSPVLSYNDHLVVALHHCANCPNRGVPIDAIINDLGGNLPMDSTAPACVPAANAGPDQTICLGDSVTIGTPAVAGNTYLWAPGGETTAEITVSPAMSTTYTVTVDNMCDTNSDDVLVTVLDPNGQLPPISDDFEAAQFPSTDWQLDNPDGAVAWERTTAVSGFGVGTASALFNNFDDDHRGTTDSLITPFIDLSGGGTVTLEFDVAYAQYSNNFSDQLDVMVSTDCGSSWSQIYSQAGTSLSTTGFDVTSSFVPNSNQWRTENIDVSAFAGNSSVRFAFVNVTGWGNNLYIDNINITSTGIDPDNDMDGVTVGQGDCNDNDPNVNPNMPETTCDGIDNDCNAATEDDPDGDMDGVGVCNDCNDADPNVNPNATEVTCDSVDNDCNAATLDDPDGDMDGVGLCNDCNDADPNINPNASETTCDMIDNDCDPATEDDPDGDMDGVGVCNDCNDADPAVNPNASETTCDMIDNDCDPATEDDPDGDMDGVGMCTDCDDANASMFPGNSESCDGLDNDCDGVIPDDEGDDDNDGTLNCAEQCPNGDTDGDGICDDVDNCVDVANGDQADSDGNGVGDACDDVGTPGDGCGCNAEGSPNSFGGMLFLLGMVGFTLRRRRRELD